MSVLHSKFNLRAIEVISIDSNCLIDVAMESCKLAAEKKESLELQTFKQGMEVFLRVIKERNNLVIGLINTDDSDETA